MQYIVLFLSHILRLSLQTMRFVPAQTDKEFPARLSELSKEGTVEPVLLHDSTEREFPVRLIRISKKNDTAEKTSYGQECRCGYYVLFDSLC